MKESTMVFWNRFNVCRAALGDDGRVYFSNAKGGQHSVAADDLRRVNAHWIGFCRNNAWDGVASPRRITAAMITEAKAKHAAWAAA